MKKWLSVLCIVALAAPLNADFKQLTQAKVEQTTISTSPELKLYVPNGVIDILLRNSIGISDTEYAARYDYLNNFTNNRLDFKLRFPLLFTGTELYDELNYSVLYKQQLSAKNALCHALRRQAVYSCLFRKVRRVLWANHNSVRRHKNSFRQRAAGSWDYLGKLRYAGR